MMNAFFPHKYCTCIRISSRNNNTKVRKMKLQCGSRRHIPKESIDILIMSYSVSVTGVITA